MMHDSEGNARVFDITADILELRKSPPAISDSLKTAFSSGESLLTAEVPLLRDCGLHRHDALLFSRIAELSRYSENSSYGLHPQLGSLVQAAAYLRSHYIGLQIEHFYILCLDEHGKLIESVRLNEGTQDAALFDTRRLLYEAARLSPAAIIMSHNHPRGTLRPSDDDIRCTLDTISALSSIGIPLIDHIIIAGRSAVSFRDNGFIDIDVWFGQTGANAMIKDWLK